MKLTDVQRVHFIGVGGIGVSALARLCLHDGKKVSGSDIAETDLTKKLTEEGVKIFYEQVAENVPEDVELVVYSEAVSSDNPELKAAKKTKAKVVNYFDALGMFVNEYYLIAVAGSHGKTTTTAMLSDIFEKADLDPTVIVGSIRNKTGTNFRPGKSKYAIVEACEFRRDFMSLEPDVLVITNIEYEHVDYYKNLEDVQSAFRELAQKVSPDGAIVANTDDPHIKAALEGLEIETIDYTQFFNPQFEMAAFGVHNHLNAAAAIAVANYVGVDVYLSREALKNFEGTWRRFQHCCNVNGAEVFDDYAHHPTEIKMTIKAAKERFPEKRIVAVFQPHTQSRTKELFDDFVAELAKADEVLLLPIYEAREEKKSDVDSHSLCVAVTGKNPHAKYFETIDEVVKNIHETVTKDDLVLIMGAGPIAVLAKELSKK